MVTSVALINLQELPKGKVALLTISSNDHVKVKPKKLFQIGS
jgi:hypothetical protein